MPKAVEYILQVFDQIPSMDELLQMSIIEVIRLDCKTDTSHRVRPSTSFSRLSLIMDDLHYARLDTSF